MDMDGTLIDSMPYWNTLSPDYLVERGITKSTEGLVEILRTMTMPQACVYLKKNMIFLKRRKRSCGSSTKSCAGIMRRTFL